MNQRMEPNSLWTPLPTQDERSAAGRALRRLVPRGALGRWRAAEDRPDPPRTSPACRGPGWSR